MAKKVIIDCDPGIDDAVALSLALFDTRLEVLAVTAVEGNVSASRASLNVQTVVDQLDPPRYPRLGAATRLDAAPATDMRHLHGENGLGNADFPVSQLHHQHPSEKILCDEVRTAPEQVTLLCLGPLSNLARAFQRDPALPEAIDQVIISGGSADCRGDVTPVAEFNMFYDPPAARAVFRSPLTKILIPLEITQQVRLNLDLLEQLPDETTRAGRLLRRVVPFAFRAYRQLLGRENICLQSVVSLAAALHPELFAIQEIEGDVEIAGELTRGVTVFDRRGLAPPRSTMGVATEVDAAAVTDCILRGLADAGRAT
jgi:inosine-uridine nucleoside N-ribohydrolase